MSTRKVLELIKTAEGKKAYLDANKDEAKLLDGSMPVSNRKPMGRPRTIDDPEEMLLLIEAYFKECEGRILLDGNGTPVLNKYGEAVIVGARPPSVAGLCLALGLVSREGLDGYLKRPEFSDIIKRAKLFVETATVEACFDKEASQGARFVLSAVHKYATIKETNVTGEVEVKHRIADNLTDDDKKQLLLNAAKSIEVLNSEPEIVEVKEDDLKVFDED